MAASNEATRKEPGSANAREARAQWTALHTKTYEGVLSTPINACVNTVLTAQQLSEIVPLHPVTILRWARAGRIPHRRLSARKVVFLLSEINAWLASDSNLYTDAATRAASTEREAA